MRLGKKLDVLIKKKECNTGIDGIERAADYIDNTLSNYKRFLLIITLPVVSLMVSVLVCRMIYRQIPHVALLRMLISYFFPTALGTSYY